MAQCENLTEIKVPVFEDKELGDPSLVTITCIQLKSEKKESEYGYEFHLSYKGLLYQGCGSACLPQGYKLKLDNSCKVKGFIKDSKFQLLKYNKEKENFHEALSDNELERLVKYANNKKTLTDIYHIISQPTEELKNEGYDARVSQFLKKDSHSENQENKLSLFINSGNTSATFFVHLGKIRKALADQFKLKECEKWPQYNGPQLPSEFRERSPNSKK